MSHLGAFLISFIEKGTIRLRISKATICGIPKQLYDLLIGTRVILNSGHEWNVYILTSG